MKFNLSIEEITYIQLALKSKLEHYKEVKKMFNDNEKIKDNAECLIKEYEKLIEKFEI